MSTPIFGIETLPFAIERPLAFLDLETTGTDTATDRIVEIAIAVFTPDRGMFRSLHRINPGIPIPAEATAVHGISDADVAPLPTFDRCAAVIHQMIDGADFAGFGIARFDLPILRRQMLEVGMPFDLVGRRVVDALTVFHKKHPRDLSAAVREYCGRELDGAHNAMVDVAATIEVLVQQFARHEDLHGGVAAMHEFCGGDEGLAVDCTGKFRMVNGRITFAFGKHEGRPLADVAQTDPSFLNWMLGRDFPADTKELARKALRGGVS